MRTYFKPIVQVSEAETFDLMHGESFGLTNGVGGGGQMTKQNSGFWEDEYEDDVDDSW